MAEIKTAGSWYTGGIFYILLVFIIKCIHTYCKNVFKIQNCAKQKMTPFILSFYSVHYVYVCVSMCM